MELKLEGSVKGVGRRHSGRQQGVDSLSLMLGIWVLRTVSDEYSSFLNDFVWLASLFLKRGAVNPYIYIYTDRHKTEQLLCPPAPARKPRLKPLKMIFSLSVFIQSLSRNRVL